MRGGGYKGSGRGGPRALVPGGVGGRGHGPQGRSKFRNLCRIFDVSNAEEKWRLTCVVFLTFLMRTKKKKNGVAFF